MQREHSSALAPIVLKSCGFDERLLSIVKDWASSLVGSEPAEYVCLLMQRAFQFDVVGMYLMSYSILSSAEKLLVQSG